MAHGAARDTLALVAGADPALVIRLLILQHLYAPERSPCGTLKEVLEGLPYDVLMGWIEILRHCTAAASPTSELASHGRSWSLEVREQIYNYRARLIGARLCRTPLEVEQRVFELYRRLCSRECLVDDAVDAPVAELRTPAGRGSRAKSRGAGRVPAGALPPGVLPPEVLPPPRLEMPSAITAARVRTPMLTVDVGEPS